MRTSVKSYNEAVNEVKAFFEKEGINWGGEKFPGNYIVEDRSADCEAFPCPPEIGSWSGEVCALYVCNFDTQEEIFACAYWE